MHSDVLCRVYIDRKWKAWPEHFIIRVSIIVLNVHVLLLNNCIQTHKLIYSQTDISHNPSTKKNWLILYIPGI